MGLDLPSDTPMSTTASWFTFLYHRVLSHASVHNNSMQCKLWSTDWHCGVQVYAVACGGFTLVWVTRARIPTLAPMGQTLTYPALAIVTGAYL